jgi:hypothetical protein
VLDLFDYLVFLYSHILLECLCIFCQCICSFGTPAWWKISTSFWGNSVLIFGVQIIVFDNNLFVFLYFHPFGIILRNENCIFFNLGNWIRYVFLILILKLFIVYRLVIKHWAVNIYILLTENLNVICFQSCSFCWDKTYNWKQIVMLAHRLLNFQTFVFPLFFLFILSFVGTKSKTLRTQSLSLLTCTPLGQSIWYSVFTCISATKTLLRFRIAWISTSLFSHWNLYSRFPLSLLGQILEDP